MQLSYSLTFWLVGNCCFLRCFTAGSCEEKSSRGQRSSVMKQGQIISCMLVSCFHIVAVCRTLGQKMRNRRDSWILHPDRLRNTHTHTHMLRDRPASTIPLMCILSIHAKPHQKNSAGMEPTTSRLPLQHRQHVHIDGFQGDPQFGGSHKLQLLHIFNKMSPCVNLTEFDVFASS